MKKVSQIILNLIIEICCSFCYYEKLHENHKLLKLSDSEELKKENITIESTTKEFNENINKIIELKNKIENEINKINILYEKTIDELSKSYLKKHEILLKEENELKDKLQNEVTKVKEQLENYLSESNNEIKLSERINKGIKKMENEDKNMIKILSYVSKINKTQKNMKKLFSQLMRNIKFKYEEEKSNIEYEEYYFNGIYIPNNIEIKDISSNSFNLNWNIDNINIINLDKNKIKYIVEIKKEKEEFKKVYEGEKNNCLINNLTKNTNYELRICSLYNDLKGFYSQIQKIKTLNIENIDSIILKESNRNDELLGKIYEWIGNKRMKLIFRGTRDGMTNTSFHNKCDNKGKTITLIRNVKGYICGGYASIPWTSDNNYHSAPDSFLFTLTNIHNIEPTKFPSKNDNKEVYHGNRNGPRFGGGTDLGIYPDFIKEGAWSYFPYSYQDVLGKGKSIFTGDLNNNNSEFKINEIEIFQIE